MYQVKKWGITNIPKKYRKTKISKKAAIMLIQGWYQEIGGSSDYATNLEMAEELIDEIRKNNECAFVEEGLDIIWSKGNYYLQVQGID